MEGDLNRKKRLVRVVEGVGEEGGLEGGEEKQGERGKKRGVRLSLVAHAYLL